MNSREDIPSPRITERNDSACRSGWFIGIAGTARLTCACSVVLNFTAQRTPSGDEAGAQFEGFPLPQSPMPDVIAPTISSCVMLPATENTTLFGTYCSCRYWT